MKSEKQTILIVDDIEMNRDILEHKFCQYYNTHCCENGLEALVYTKDHEKEIVAVLLDLVMPVMTGIQFLSIIREQKFLEDVPIFIITAEDNENIQLGTFDFGITDVITKPFNAKFLLKRVSSQIDLYLTKRSLEYTNMVQSQLLVERSKELAELSMKVTSTLALAIEMRSGETGTHVKSIQNMTRNVLTLLRNEKFNDQCAKMSDDDIENISYSSVLHDIGKIVVPDAVLNKPGRLTPEEYEIIKTHTVKGAELIDQIGLENNEVLSYAYDICRHHHERWDGRGYPDKLVGDNISIWAQIVSIADVYDALTQDRCYKKAFPKDKAISMIRNNECGVFNPDLCKVFCENIDKIDIN